MGDRQELDTERLQAAIANTLPPRPVDPTLPRVESGVEEWLPAGTVAVACLQVISSYLASFLGHAVLIIGLSVAASFALPGDRIAMEGGLTVAVPIAELESNDVAVEVAAPISELEQLHHSPAESARSLADAVALSGPAAGEQLLEDWGDGPESDFDDAVAAAWEDEFGGSEPVDKSKGDARFFGVHASGRRFVFIIDCSGSMKGLRWNLAKAELKNSIRNLDQEKEFLVILYNHQTWVMFDRDLVNSKLVPATPQHQRQFLQWLGQQKPFGWTRPRLALELALKREPDAIFLLSDGELQDDSQQFLVSSNQPREQLDGTRRQTPVHTVALDLSEGSGLLEKIAGENSGVFTHITTSNSPRR